MSILPSLRLLWWAGVFVLGNPASAIAEVCDKEFPTWNPMHDGPASSMSALVDFLSSPLGLLSICGAAVVHLARPAWIHLAATGVAALGALAILWNWRFHGSAYADAIEEGCVASPIYVIYFFVAVAVLSAVRAVVARVLRRLVPSA